MLAPVLIDNLATTEPVTGNTPETRPENRAFYPALDGLRAVAFLMVFLQHYYAMPWGWTGVNIFFVLSGFLITGILFDSRDDPHRARNFYVRRTLRIFPLYYAIVFALLLAEPIMHWQWSRAWIAWPLYLGNLLRAWSPRAGMAGSTLQIAANGWLESPRFPQLGLSLGHFWSLCVEEQFYLIWPWVVFWIRSRRTLLWVCGSVVLADVVLRFVGQSFLPAWMIHQDVLHSLCVRFSTAGRLGRAHVARAVQRSTGVGRSYPPLRRRRSRSHLFCACPVLHASRPLAKLPLPNLDFDDRYPIRQSAVHKPVALHPLSTRDSLPAVFAGAPAVAWPSIVRRLCLSRYLPHGAHVLDECSFGQLGPSVWWRLRTIATLSNPDLSTLCLCAYAGAGVAELPVSGKPLSEPQGKVDHPDLDVTPLNAASYGRMSERGTSWPIASICSRPLGAVGVRVATRCNGPLMHLISSSAIALRSRLLSVPCSYTIASLTAAAQPLRTKRVQEVNR
jgi:hypothetical protein